MSELLSTCISLCWTTEFSLVEKFYGWLVKKFSIQLHRQDSASDLWKVVSCFHTSWWSAWHDLSGMLSPLGGQMQVQHCSQRRHQTPLRRHLLQAFSHQPYNVSERRSRSLRIFPQCSPSSGKERQGCQQGSSCAPSGASPTQSHCPRLQDLRGLSAHEHQHSGQHK